VTTLVRHRNQAVPDELYDERRGSGSMTDDELERAGTPNRSSPSDAGIHPTVQAAKEWLDSSRGRARSRLLVSTNGYPISDEELRDEALAQIWSRMQRHPDKPIDNVEAYCQRVMGNLCTRAGKARFLTEDRSDESELGYEDIVNLDGLHKTAPELASRCRSAIETLDGDVEVKSAALNFLTLSLYPETDCSDLPSPQRGATPLQARWWRALALALQTPDLFPGAVASSAAQRQRRRRFVMECQEFLDRTYVEVARKDLDHG